MSIERDTIVLLIYISISLIYKSTLLIELIRYTLKETIYNRSIKSKSLIINEDIIRRIV